MSLDIKKSTPILDVLKYFQVFDFPLTIEEIYRYGNCNFSNEILQEQINKLLEDQMIFKFDDCYSLIDSIESTLKKKAGYKLAETKSNEVQKVAKIINAFPFVRMVGLTGALSKNFFKKGDDIDFFIVTSKNRLWIARTSLHLFKKFTFLVGKEHSFCMNYFVDETALCIDEQNLFTAIELESMKPIVNQTLHSELLDANKWRLSYTPNTIFKEPSSSSFTLPVFKSFIEFFLNSNKLNSFFMNLTDSKWRKKWSKKGFDMSRYDIAFKTTLNVSKNHPNNYQDKLLKELKLD